MENIIIAWLFTILIGLWLTWRNNNDVINLNKVNYQTLTIFEANYNFIQYVLCSGMIIIFLVFMTWIKM